MENYVKKGEVFNKDIMRAFYHQNFLLKINVTTNVDAITKMFIDGDLNEIDVQLTEFIYKSNFVTYGQIARYAEIKGIIGVDKFLKRMTENYIINKFCLAGRRGRLTEVPEDAEVFYCLHDGGRILLERYSKFSPIYWTPGFAGVSSRMIFKRLMITEVTLDLLANENVTDLQLESSPKFRNPSMSEVFQGQVSYRYVTKPGAIKYLLVDTICGWDEEHSARNRINNYTYLMTTNAWRKYYHKSETPPDVVIITDSDETSISSINYMIDCAKSETNADKGINRMTKAEIAAFTTPQRLKNGLCSPDSLIGYDIEIDGVAKFPLVIE